STRAGTSRPGNSRSCFLSNSEPRLGRCADRGEEMPVKAFLGPSVEVCFSASASPPNGQLRSLPMDTLKMFEDIDHHRRRFFGTAALGFAAAQLGMMGSADAQSSKTKPAQLAAIKPGTHTSFASLKQVDAGLLNVGYAGAGPADGPAVILLHGWPYDIHSFVDVAPPLASAGYRVIVPYLRGYGTTRFLSGDAPRNGQQS